MRPATPQATTALRCCAARSSQRLCPRHAPAAALPPPAQPTHSVVHGRARLTTRAFKADPRVKLNLSRRESAAAASAVPLAPSLSTRSGSSPLKQPAGTQKSLTQQPYRQAQEAAAVVVQEHQPPPPPPSAVPFPRIDSHILALGFSTSPVNTGNPSAIPWDLGPTPPTVHPIDEPTTATSVTEYIYAPFSTSPFNTGNPAFWDLIADVEPAPSSPLADITSHPVTAAHAFAPVKMSPPPPPPASDDDYAAFLEKADADKKSASSSSGAKASQAQGKQTFTQSSVDDNASVPAPLKSLGERYFVSESDEKFEPVALRASGKTLGVQMVKQATGYSDVAEVKHKDFDPRGEYSDVVDAVKKAAAGDVKVFRIGLGGARCEYWVLGLDGDGAMLVGVRAGAVES